MMRVIYFALMGCLASPVFGQEIEVQPLRDSVIGQRVPSSSRNRAEIADKGVTVRALDKVSGEVVDFDLAPGQTKQLGRIKVTLGECRYPLSNPSGDAYAYLKVFNTDEDAPVFSGWMIASSPALNALDHARYDVWPLRCITSEGE